MDMKTTIVSLLAAILLFTIPTYSQETADSAAPGPNLDSLYNAGMDELLSYLRLDQGDFHFRDDYTEKDPYRLTIVDSLMRSPLLMVDFADDCAEQLEIHKDDLLGGNFPLLRYFESIRGVNQTVVDSTQNKAQSIFGSQETLPENKVRDMKKGGVRYGICRHIGEFMSLAGQNWMDACFVKDTSFEIRSFIRSKFREMILEDVNMRDKPVDVIDSLSDLEEEYAKQFSEIGTNIGESIFRAKGLAWSYRLIDSLRNELLNDPDVDLGPDAENSRYESHSGLGNIAFGTTGDDVYTGDYFLIIDPGGNDRYYLSYEINTPHPVIIADFSGNDYYKAETDFALACGALNYSLLIDYEGDDIYDGGNFSLGAGYFGVGLLWDKKGNDKYFGDTFTMGAGTFGLGLLIDNEGADVYTGNLFCQGFGFVKGIGGIADFAGNDNYIVQPKYREFYHPGNHFQSLSQGFGYGLRPHMSGGFGFICDYGGNDNYVADFFAQASSYWWSLGMINDKSGNDQYLTYQYAQGAGAHMTLGILLDGAGDDVYRSHGVAQGCGHYYSCGILLDRGGDDIYSSAGLSQGAGQANGFGIFADLMGNDGYYVFHKADCQGYGNPRRDYGSIGLFLDMDGEDHYDGNGSNDHFWTIPSKWGGGLDRSIVKPDSTEAK